MMKQKENHTVHRINVVSTTYIMTRSFKSVLNKSIQFNSIQLTLIAPSISSIEMSPFSYSILVFCMTSVRCALLSTFVRPCCEIRRLYQRNQIVCRCRVRKLIVLRYEYYPNGPAHPLSPKESQTAKPSTTVLTSKLSLTASPVPPFSFSSLFEATILTTV